MKSLSGKSSLAAECDSLMHCYREAMSCLEQSLGKILVKVYSVESETFRNYKFKDVSRVFEDVISEMHKL